ncbi:MAG: helix-turn-helix domain-containing protein [Anaerolineae bacterium]|nr:helix-turn-helix domain-containing protein [Anaerolineae bacterium]
MINPLPQARLTMTDTIQELTFPPITFGINQVFDETFDSGWVAFPGHYLLYASSGAFRLAVGQVQWLLPPQRAAWVAAHVPLRLSAAGPGTTSSVLFAEEAIPKPEFTSRVFAVSSLAREMLLYATRWGPDRDSANQTADSFFQALAAVCTDLAVDPDEFWLPQAQSTELDQAMAYTLSHLADKLTLADVAAAAHISERTLARRFSAETGMTWSQFVHRARMIRAMELLASPDTKIIEVVYAVGYASVSAFNNAFRHFTGDTPSGYCKRIQPR